VLNGNTLLDINATASKLGTTVRHIRRLVAEKRIPYLKVGHLLRFDPDEITTWLQQSRQHAHDHPGAAS
jgi:excisionase family DNA binding protein